MKHISDGIAGDLDKLNPDHRAQIRQVAGLDLDAATPKGANRDPGAVDMNRKIGPHRDVARPDPNPPPMGSGKLKADWPAPTHGTFSSGMARAGRLGSMPSDKAPPR
jgi:hypothetical protein